MKTTLPLLILTALLAFACNPSRKLGPELPALKLSAEEQQTHKTDMAQFLAGAVTYGMEADRFPIPLATELLGENSNWVGKCPVCDNVRRGMATYKRAADPDTQTRLNKEDAEALGHADDSVRRPALQALVDRYVRQYYTVLSMTEAEQRAMKSQLESGRKRGMGLADGGEGFFCPSCDGACELPARQ